MSEVHNLSASRRRILLAVKMSENTWYNEIGVKEIAAELAAMSEQSRIEFVRRKLVPVVEYILTVTDLDEKVIREVIEEKLPGGGDIVESTAERLRKEGKKKGRKEGRKEELVETLQSLLGQRFTEEQPEELKEMIENADRKDLIKIRDKIFDIESLEEVRELLK